MSLRPFRLATILEAVKVAELRYLDWKQDMARARKILEETE